MRLTGLFYLPVQSEHIKNLPGQKHPSSVGRALQLQVLVVMPKAIRHFLLQFTPTFPLLKMVNSPFLKLGTKG